MAGIQKCMYLKQLYVYCNQHSEPRVNALRHSLQLADAFRPLRFFLMRGIKDSRRQSAPCAQDPDNGDREGEAPSNPSAVVSVMERKTVAVHCSTWWRGTWHGAMSQK